jgi:hypothetical protein
MIFMEAAARAPLNLENGINGTLNAAIMGAAIADAPLRSHFRPNQASSRRDARVAVRSKGTTISGATRESTRESRSAGPLAQQLLLMSPDPVASVDNVT